MTEERGADLVDAGVAVFRVFVVDYPILFEIGFRRALVSPDLAAHFDAARLAALARLERLVARLDHVGRLGSRSVTQATLEFHALCEGLAAIELRGIVRPGYEESIWRDALAALVAGFAATP